MKISIIILNFNGSRDTLDCLKTVKQLELKDSKLEIVVVDNGSSKMEIKKLSDKIQNLKTKFKITLIENKQNLGYSEGNNRGIKYALQNKSDYILLLNNDTLVDKNLLIQLIKVAKKKRKAGIVSPKIYFAPGFEYHKNRYQKQNWGKVIWYAGGLFDRQNILASHRGVDEIDQGQYDQIIETAFATGCCMLIKSEVFDKIGLFNPKYFLYWEDIDLCFRAKRAGFKIIYAPLAKIWHKNASSSGGAGQQTSIYYQTRNRLLFACKYAFLKTKFFILKEGLIKFFQGNSLEKRAVKDFFLFNFGKMKK